MTYEELSAAAKAAGFTACAPLDAATIELKQEVRDMCQANTCGQYDKRWSCPPGCGDLDACRETLNRYPRGILVQTSGEIEDGFDFEAMAEIESEHKEHFRQMYAALRQSGADVLALGAGCCTKCAQCSYPDEPCRFPEEAVASMEAYGMLVMEVCKSNGLAYYYGSDHMAYTSCFLLGDKA
jgi:predicted metal-binding protein